MEKRIVLIFTFKEHTHLNIFNRRW